MLRLRRVTLTQFRNYAALTWAPASRILVLHGPNGSGKTNLLEAVSLLAPGRGLRGARIAEVARRGPGADGRWAVAARLATKDGPLTIGTGTPPDGPPDRRAFRLDGERPRSQAEIAARMAAIWLTPLMDRLFQEGSSGRRRFLDRLVLALEPGHARELSAHESALAERSRLLARDHGADAAWLTGLEDQIARHAVAATASRMALAARLDRALSEGVVAGFPPSRLALLCPIAERLRADPAVSVEDWLRAALAASRLRDRETGGASLGAHRADFTLSDEAGLPAGLASTGEQKSMLLGIVLAHAGLVEKVHNFAPLLLLDEPAVHLDSGRRAALFAALGALPAQVLLTGTDAETFLPLADCAEAWRTGGGALARDSRFSDSETPVPPGPEPA